MTPVLFGWFLVYFTTKLLLRGFRPNVLDIVSLVDGKKTVIVHCKALQYVTGAHICNPHKIYTQELTLGKKTDVYKPQGIVDSSLLEFIW